MRSANVLSTYRSLRIGMVVLVVMLAVSVFIQAGTAGCWQSSISAYYFTDTHAIFVAALCALGTLLLVYKGSNDTEDALYDFAGFWAFVVATVPTGWPTNLSADGQSRVRGLCGGTGLPNNFDTAQALTNNVLVVFIGLAAVLILSAALVPGRSWRLWTFGGKLVRGFGAVITGLLLLSFLTDRDWFEQHAHNWAAVPMFAFIIVAVWANALTARRGPKTLDGYRPAYWAVGIAMLLTLLTVLGLVLSRPWTLYVLVAEFVLLLEFAIFWVIQTFDLWHYVRREPDQSETAGLVVSKL
ncbi:hypothetical protein CH254_24095 [Rhodococcus sp. 06-412-2C]|nr:hypothetical protein CH254_24095 [Rhodococcus sp. 06-412-2C]OZC94156.1 hypothetical protein CH279_22180 [Rhodococcus sp. 06-412-2B]